MREGYDLNSELSQKIWFVSQIIKCSPFSSEVLSLTLPQIDFIIGMYSLDTPDVGKKIRPDLFEDRSNKSAKEAAWLSVLPQDAIMKKFGLDDPKIQEFLNRKKHHGL